MQVHFLIMDSSMNCLPVILQTSQTVPVRVLPKVHEKHKHPYAPHGKVPIQSYCIVFVLVWFCSPSLAFM